VRIRRDGAEGRPAGRSSADTGSSLSIAGPFTGLEQIQCPTVIIGGAQDHRTTPAAHQELAQDIPGSVILMIENSGHFTPLEQPDAVTDGMRRWLVS
jgi:pimeloyl-ACP methyl ester carboxylesterase